MNKIKKQWVVNVNFQDDLRILALLENGDYYLQIGSGYMSKISKESALKHIKKSIN